MSCKVAIQSWTKRSNFHKICGRILPVGQTDETEIKDGQYHKGKGSDFTQLWNLKLLDNPELQVLTDRVAKFEEGPATNLTIAAIELESKFVHL